MEGDGDGEVQGISDCESMKSIAEQKARASDQCRLYITQHRWSRQNQPKFGSWHATLLTWAGNARRRYMASCDAEKIGQGELF